MAIFCRRLSAGATVHMLNIFSTNHGFHLGFFSRPVGHWNEYENRRVDIVDEELQSKGGSYPEQLFLQ